MIKLQKQDLLNLICATAIIIVARDIVTSLIPINFQISIIQSYGGLLGWTFTGLLALICFLVAAVPAIFVLRKQSFEYAGSISFIGVVIGTPVWIICWFLSRYVPFSIYEISMFASIFGGLVLAAYLVRYVIKKK